MDDLGVDLAVAANAKRCETMRNVEQSNPLAYESPGGFPTWERVPGTGRR